MLAGADVQAHAKLYAADGGFVASCRTRAALPAGISQLAFRFTAQQIFRSGKAGPYTLRLLSLWGSTVSLRVPGVVATTQPYLLEDFAPPPRFTVGGTVTGLAGSGLVLRDLHFLQITPGNGPFTFPLPTETGEPYGVSVVTQPSQSGADLHDRQRQRHGGRREHHRHRRELRRRAGERRARSCLRRRRHGGGRADRAAPSRWGCSPTAGSCSLARRVLTRYTDRRHVWTRASARGARRGPLQRRRAGCRARAGDSVRRQDRRRWLHARRDER